MEETLRSLRGPRRSGVRSVGAALAGPGAATLIGLGVPHRTPTTAAVLFILGVVAAAGWGGVWSGLAAAVASFVGLNYFFTPPVHTFRVQRVDDLVALAVFV